MEDPKREEDLNKRIATAALVAITLIASALLGYWLGSMVNLLMPP